MSYREGLLLGWCFTFLLIISTSAKEEKTTTIKEQKPKELVKKLPNSYWKSRLEPQVYAVTRCSATEAPFTGRYWNNHACGKYRCSNCGKFLFDSEDKFDSGTGWPSFSNSQPEAVETKTDMSHGMVRDEVVCKHCGAHLGHLFTDGPTPTGKRFCINSASLDFKEEDKKPTK